jgi:hypothetical protein
LRRYTEAKIKAVWPREAADRPMLDDPAGLQLLEAFQQSLRGLAPKTDTQRLILADAATHHRRSGENHVAAGGVGGE